MRMFPHTLLGSKALLKLRRVSDRLQGLLIELNDKSITQQLSLDLGPSGLLLETPG